MYDDGKVTRDFIHVLDLAEAIKCCIENDYRASNFETYNVGSQEGVTIREVLNLINKVSNDKIQTISKPPRAFDCEFNVLSIHKINSELGWEPKIKIKKGLENVWNWINSEIK